MLFRIRQYIAVFLLLAISLFIVPKEYIHNFYGHDDTHDITSKDVTIANIHHHCQILNYNTPNYIFQHKAFLLPVSFIEQSILPYRQFSFIIPFSSYFNLRAPPEETFPV
ncbi:MAG: hypothetical protein ABR968_01455 [Bacteroidales bacterium]|jgi:hypothetical protein